MKKYLLLLLCIILLQTQLKAQIGISATNSPPNASAMLDVSSTTKGFLAPRMTTAQRLAIAPAAAGLLIFDTNTKSYWYCNFVYSLGGTPFSNWSEIPNKPLWELNGLGGNEISNTNTGGFWSKNATTVTTDPGTFTTPVSGEGTRIMWMPAKSAFRVGTVSQYTSYSTAWDASNIGTYSFATGYSSKASGSISTALGYYTNASGYSSTAIGFSTTASGSYSTAMGTNSNASGYNSITMGAGTTASNENSTAMGYSTTASGYSSTAMGHYSTASGGYSTAMGYNTTASGSYSTAMGNNANTNSKTFSFAISGASTTPRAINDKDYQMKMHFDEYQFLTGTDKNVTISSDGKLTTNNSLWAMGSINLNLGNYGYLSNNSSSPTGFYSGTTSVPVSIFAIGRVTATEFDAFSDIRHKKLRSYSNGKTDLELLNQLKVSNYTFIDTVGKGTKIQMGFIAQQVEEIVPEAVNKIQDYIPSVYDMAKSMVYDASLHTLTITTFKPHDFQAKDEIKLISLDKEHKVKVDKIMDANTFIVNNWEKPVDKIFVFGKRVDDFRTVDYDRLFTLGISSIQELSRRVEQLEKENGILKSESKAFSKMKSEIAELRAMILK